MKTKIKQFRRGVTAKNNKEALRRHKLPCRVQFNATQRGGVYLLVVYERKVQHDEVKTSSSP
jgi:hypothetical protein